MSLVLDASATLAWIYPDETSNTLREVFDRVADAGAVVPSLWRWEVANGLTTAVRRGRIDVVTRSAALADLGLLRIEIDPDASRHSWTTTLQLADQFALTVYDAAYVELAQRHSLPLASLDAEMRAAARQLDLSLINA